MTLLRVAVEVAVRIKGAEVWLLTSLRNADPDAEVMKNLSASNKQPFDDLTRVHDAYNDGVRRSGEETGTVVVDLEADSRRNSCQPILLPLDVPHPARGGHNLEGEAHDSVRVRRGLLG